MGPVFKAFAGLSWATDSRTEPVDEAEGETELVDIDEEVRKEGDRVVAAESEPLVKVDVTAEVADVAGADVGDETASAGGLSVGILPWASGKSGWPCSVMKSTSTSNVSKSKPRILFCA